MADSLRARLLAWYVGMVMLVIASVATAVCWVTWRSRLTAIDAELRSRAASVSSAVLPGVGGGFDVELPSDATTYFQASRSRPYYAVWSASGVLVDRSDPDVIATTLPAEGVRTRGNRREVITRSGGLTILTGRDISEIWRELWSLAITMLGVALAGIVVASGCAWFLAGRALAPVQRINETARRMTQGDLTARIAVDRTETELGQVALALNVAFDRLRDSIERQRQFTADASHQLRTPVATMMAELDWAIKRERTAAEYRESLDTCRRAGARMHAIVNGLLTLARADSGDLTLGRQDVRMDRIVAETVDVLRPVAATHHVSIDTSAERVTVSGDPDRLQDLVSNLLFNAITYNRPNGTVSVDLRHDGEWVELRVGDTGIGITPTDLPHIFDRFYRAEPARAREPAGAGLGLALAQWIAAAHGGSITCSSELGRSAEFRVRLPVAAHAAAAADAGRLNARFATPPTTPIASTASVTAGVQIDARPSAASSE
jgi:two-component system, OmpR family, sensor kinase